MTLTFFTSYGHIPDDMRGANTSDMTYAITSDMRDAITGDMLHAVTGDMRGLLWGIGSEII